MKSSRQMMMLLLVAFLFRVAALFPASMHHPDEIFQYLEPAHRLIFGYGTVPWEYRYGMRSWLVPLLVAPLMALGHFIAPTGILYAKLPVLLSVASGLSITWSAWTIGRRMGPQHGLIASFAVAIWFEQIFFSTHLLTEVLAAGCIIPAAALLTLKNPSARHWLSAGFLLGLAFILRFQYAPPIALLLLWTSISHLRRCWLPIAAGGFAALIPSITADIAVNQVPFSWIIENFKQNIILNRSSHYGVDGPTAYISLIWQYWGWAAVPLFLLLLPRRVIENNRVLFWVAILNLVVHSTIAHKEYRFIFLTVTILVIIAAIGSAELTTRISSRLGIKPVYSIFATMLLWLGSSAALSVGEPMKTRWAAFSPAMELARNYGSAQASCGVALHRLRFWQSGGYTYLHRDLPTYLTGWSETDRMNAGDFRAASGGFNGVIAPERSLRADLGYRSTQCLGSDPDENSPNARLCLFVRAGGCTPKAAQHWELQNVLLRHDQ